MFHITILNSDLPNVSNEKETSIPLVFIDTAGCGVHELETEDTESKGNEGAIILHVCDVCSLSLAYLWTLWIIHGKLYRSK